MLKISGFYPGFLSNKQVDWVYSQCRFQKDWKYNRSYITFLLYRMFLMKNFPEVNKMDNKLNGRFEALTGLTTETAEQLQVSSVK